MGAPQEPNSLEEATPAERALQHAAGGSRVNPAGIDLLHSPGQNDLRGPVTAVDVHVRMTRGWKFDQSQTRAASDGEVHVVPKDAEVQALQVAADARPTSAILLQTDT